MIKFRLEERAKSPYWLIIFSPFIAILVAIILAGILIVLAGANPFESYYQLIIGAFGSKNSFAETLARATPIILTGLAASIAFRAKFWNIGAEGQLYFGALATTMFGTGLVVLPSILKIPFLFIMGALAGG